MKRKIYLETSVISYLTATAKNPVAKHRQTQALLLLESNRFVPIVSEIVLDEIGRGDEEQTRKRIALVNDLEVLFATDEAVYLANLLVARKALPTKAYVDALHIAVPSRLIPFPKEATLSFALG